MKYNTGESAFGILLGSKMLIEDTISCEVNLLGMLFFKSLTKGFATLS